MRDRAWWLLMAPLVVAARVRELWAPDEPRYAQVARETYEGGSFIVLHLCGRPWPDKPPLLYWLAGLCGWLSGWSELWMRLPSLLATFGTAWLVAALAGDWWDDQVARWAPALYLGTVMVTEIGGRLQIDPLLVFCCTLALYLVTRSVADDRDKRRDVMLAGACAGLGALAKGPVAWVIVGLVVAAWSWLCPAARPRVAVRTWFVAVVLAVAPVALWAGLVAVATPELASDLFYDQHAGRVTDVAERHPGPAWKHLVRMPGLLLPWSLFVVGGAVHAVAAWRRRARSSRGETGLVQAAAWLGVLLVFFSLIPPKRDLYLLPAYPAAALLAGWFLVRTQRSGRRALPLTLATSAVLAAAGVVLTQAGRLTDAVDGLWWRGPAIGLPLVVAALIALYPLARGRVVGWAVSILAGWVVFGVALAVLGFASMNRVKSPRIFAEELAARSERPSEIPCLIGVQPANFRFYGQVPTMRATSLIPSLEVEGEHFLALVEESSWDALEPAVRMRFRLRARRTVGGKHLLLLGSPEGPPHGRSVSNARPHGAAGP